MLKDQEVAKQVLDSIALAQQAALELGQAIAEENAMTVEIIFGDINELLSALYRIGNQLAQEDTTVKLDGICETLLDSLQRLMVLFPLDIKKALFKLEFEFFPLLQSAYLHFYFWGCVYPDQDKMKYYYEHEKKLLMVNTYIEEAEKTGEYKYELSIVVLAYNKLDYTKQCVESILKTIPKHLNYELILINHGSTDGTKAYFESVNPTKQLDIKVNGTASTAVARIIEGEYYITFSNDVVAARNSIENMLGCLKSDPKIGWVVPTTPNVSNLQTIPAKYSTMAEMRKFASINNRYDPYRHEQRVRLCNPVAGFKSSTALSVGITGHFFTSEKASFPDDVISMLFRRNGYKNILAKDAHCHHFGSVTLKDEITEKNKHELYTRGRQDFLRTFGVDPWGTGVCFFPNMLPLVEFLAFEKINILGINSGLGSNPLKIKELYKEEKRFLNTIVYNVTNQQNYVADLRGVSDYVRLVKNINNFFNNLDEEFPSKFHNIIIDPPLDSISNYMELIEECIKHLDDCGALYANIIRIEQKSQIHNVFPETSFSGNWVRIKNG